MNHRARFSGLSPMPRLSLLVLVLLLSACAGSREATPEPEPAPLPEPAEPAFPPVEDFEDFDPSPYRDGPPGGALTIEHDVPARLMAGRAAAGTARTVQGFRIQIANVPDKDEADAQVEAAIRWYAEQREAGRTSGLFSPGAAPVYTVYRQPYYRVRIGNFATRAAADRALAAVAARFPGALVVPDTVTVRE